MLQLGDLLRIEGFEDLKPYQDGLQQTFEVLDLKPGERYVSVGIGKNRIPLLAALLGLEVVGLEPDHSTREYQAAAAQRISKLINQAGGKFDVFPTDIDTTPIGDLQSGFGIVECVNFNRRYDVQEIAQTLVASGPASRYFLCLHGGPGGKNDQLVQAVLRQLSSRAVEIHEGLLSSTAYPTYHKNGVVLKVG